MMCIVRRIWVISLLSACSATLVVNEDASSDSGSADGGLGDASVDAPQDSEIAFDAAMMDAAMMDASALDSGTADTGIADTGSGDDAAVEDGGEPDSATEDASMGDTGPDLESVRWLHPNISAWPVTSDLRVRFSGSQICLEYDHASDWPIVPIFGGTEVVANAWVFIERDGTWYGATWEWMRPGQTCKAQSSVAGDHIKRAPFDEASGWRPRSGEILYFMVSGLVRSPEYRNVQERTALARVTWP